jgi:ribosomal protein S18 acetylase RimI-like enzyme
VLEVHVTPTVHEDVPFGPAIRFDAVTDGETVASADLFTGSWMGDETGQLLAARWSPGDLDAARAVVSAAVQAGRPGVEINVATNAEIHDDPAERLALFEEFGFVLWQEKEGFWWAEAGQELPESDRIVARPLAEVGAERFASVVEACTVGTLDRIDADTIASMGGAGWAKGLMDAYAEPDGDSWWFLAENHDGDVVGFVGIGGFEDNVGTILHIGVVPDQRGRGYVDQLLRLVNRSARERGWQGVLSDSDTLNPPMAAAFERNGHRADGHAWHKWMQRRVAGS